MRKIAVKLPESLVQGLDRLIEIGVYANRAAAIRFGIRDLLFIELGIEVLRKHNK